jgi:hemoglobin-like flavoprotein
MTPHQIQLIRHTFALVEPHAEVMALVFYQRVFTLDPSLRSLFRTNIDEQGQKLMQMLGVAVALLEQPFALEPSLEALGRRHAGYGVADRHYGTVGEALLDTLQECLGSAFTPEVMDAWATLYAIVANAMQYGAANATDSSARPPAMPFAGSSSRCELADTNAVQPTQ